MVDCPMLAGNVTLLRGMIFGLWMRVGESVRRPGCEPGSVTGFITISCNISQPRELAPVRAARMLAVTIKTVETAEPCLAGGELLATCQL